jgi:F0F1-type ATP synthase assembly protein I
VPKGLPDSREFGFYFTLSQVGMEMVAPTCLGAVLDSYLGTMPWATVIGFVFGFVGGFIHLLLMIQRHNAEKRPGPPGETRS